MFCPDLIWLVFVGRYLLITTQGPAPGTTLPVCPRVSLSLFQSKEIGNQIDFPSSHAQE